MENIKVNRKAVSLYPFRVMDEIESGRTVYCIDKFNKNVISANDLKLNEFVEILNCNERDNRYDFYYIEETADEEKDGLDL